MELGLDDLAEQPLSVAYDDEFPCSARLGYVTLVLGYPWIADGRQGAE
ncbi:hypothetical protein [Frankia sp. AiPa1]|nr:hypothetical protein [Frankia sp. AiPa1]MCL9758748.1 hypothetical protein [Frankia sp. AiPa1]